MAFHWSLSDKSPQGSQILISILGDLKNAIVGIVSTCPLISNIIIIFTPWEFFTSALAGGLSLKFEWQQVSSSLQDSSQYSGCSQ